MSEKNTRVAPRRLDPPPYSWTFVRTLKPSGVTSESVPSSSWRMRTVRPPSFGRRWSQNTERPENWTSAIGEPASATSAADNGERQEPYGAISVTRSPSEDDSRHLQLAALRAPHLREARGPELRGDPTGAVRAHLHDQPPAGAKPRRRGRRGAVDEAEAVHAPVAQCVDRLEAADLVRKLSELPLRHVRRMERDRIHGTLDPLRKRLEEIPAHERRSHAEAPGIRA